MEAGKEVTGKVEVVNRGGLILRILNGRYRAFMPLSQMRASRITGKVGGAGEGADVAKAGRCNLDPSF